MIYINCVEFETMMLDAKLQSHVLMSLCFGRGFFFMVLAIYGHWGYLGNVI